MLQGELVQDIGVFQLTLSGLEKAFAVQLDCPEPNGYWQVQLS
jgi:hypothetical protein